MTTQDTSDSDDLSREQQEDLGRHDRSMPDLLQGALDEIASKYEMGPNNEKDETSLSHYMDLTFNVLRKGELIVVGGIHDEGLARDFAQSWLLDHVDRKIPCATIQVGRRANDFVLDMLSSRGRIDRENLETGDLHDQDWTRVSGAVSNLATANLWVEEGASMTIGTLVENVRALKQVCPEMRLMTVDSALMVEPSASYLPQHYEELGRSLKAVAVETGISIALQTTVSRPNRVGQHLVPSDLGQQQALGAFADRLVFAQRRPGGAIGEENEAILMMAKNLFGPIGQVDLWRHARLSSLKPVLDAHSLSETIRHSLDESEVE